MVKNKKLIKIYLSEEDAYGLKASLDRILLPIGNQSLEEHTYYGDEIIDILYKAHKNKLIKF